MTQRMIKDVRLIKERIRQDKDCQKSYSDQKRHDLEFNMGDKVFVRLALYKHVMRFYKKGKLVLRFVRPFEVLELMGKVTY